MNRLHWTGLVFVLAVSVAADLAASSHAQDTTHWWSSIPSFYALFGLLGCIVIILFAKVIGKLFLLKREDYYDAG